MEVFREGKFLYIGTYLCRDYIDVIIDDPEISVMFSTKGMLEKYGLSKVLKWRDCFFDLPSLDSGSIGLRRVPVVAVPGKIGAFWQFKCVVYQEPYWKFMSLLDIK